MERVMVLGSGGAGKSTLARTIGAAWDLPVFHLDRIYWQPGWTAPDPAAFAAGVSEIAAGPRWVIDGNYSNTFAPRLARADLAIFLDIPRLVCLVRAIGRRIVWHGRPRVDMADGCPEKLDPVFFTYVWNYRRDHGTRHLRMAREALGDDRVRVLAGRGAVASFTRSLSGGP